MKRILFAAASAATISLLAILCFNSSNFPVEAQSLPGGGVSSTATPAPTPTPAPTATVQPSPTAITSTSSNFNFNSTTPYWTEFSAGNTGTAITIDWSANGKMQTATVNGSATFTFTAPTGPTLGLCLRLVHDGTATTYTLTWPSGANGVKWPGGVAGANTNTAAAEDLLVCNYVGSHYDCSLTVNFS